MSRQPSGRRYGVPVPRDITRQCESRVIFSLLPLDFSASLPALSCDRHETENDPTQRRLVPSTAELGSEGRRNTGTGD